MNEMTKHARGMKFEIGETIKQVIYVYRTGFKQFMILSMISIVTTLGMTAVKAVLIYSIMLAVLIFILSFLSVYFMFRANAGFILLTQNILQGEKRTIKELFQQTKGFAANYFAISLLYGLILLIPGAGIWYSYSFVSNNTIKFGIIGLLLVPLAYLAARYYLAIPSALLAGDSGGLESSKFLVKGDFGKVLAVILLTQGIILGVSRILAEAVVLKEGFI